MRSAEEMAVLQTLAVEEARKDFWAFRQYQHPGLILGWWQRDAAMHLQQFAADLITGKRPKLIIQAPPQHGKSETIIDFIAWLSGRYPHLKTIFASFSERLGVRANMALQRIFETDRYRLAFPELQMMSSGSATTGTAPALRNREMIEFVGKRGSFRNVTIGGSVTGESLDLAVLDDPLKGREEANSQLVRDKAWAWLTDDYMTRFSSCYGFLLILTRWHVDDVAARLIAADPSIKVLTYPAVAESDDERGTVDRANRQPGEALFPELKPLEFLEAMRQTMDPGSWASLYQQRPTVAGGNLFQIDDFQRHRHNEERPYKRRVVFADTAQKTGERHDYTVIQIWGLGHDGCIYLIDQARGKYEAPELEKVARAFWRKHKAAPPEQGSLVAFMVEDKTSGTGLIQQLARGPEGIPIRPIKRSIDKYSRGLDAHPSIAAGLVSIPGDAPWTKELLGELAAFPAGAHDDQVDPLLDAIAILLLRPSYNLDNLEGVARAMGGGSHHSWQRRSLGF
jgi:predicted phage terminase large subunit-like protein